MATDAPVRVRLPSCGLALVESVHGPSFRMERREDEFHKILFVIAGRCVLLRREALELGAGTVAVVPAGLPHSLTDAEPATVLVMCMSRDYLEAVEARRRIWSDLAARASIELRGADASFIHSLLRQLLYELRSPGSARHELEASAAADRMLCRLSDIAEPKKDESGQNRVRRFLADLAKRPYEDLTAGSAAAACGLSQRQFRALFREQTGERFSEHLSRLRVDYAAELLSEKGYSIVAASFSAGFRDLSSFYRGFRRHRGAPPGTFRRDRL